MNGLRWTWTSLVALAALAPGAPAQSRYEPERGQPVRGQPYTEYRTVDSLGRSVRFYLSDAASAGAAPLVVYVHGSGNAAHFQRAGDRIAPANGHATLVDEAGPRARVLIVEKPGVAPYQPATSDHAEVFRREHSLERWAEAVAAAALAAARLPGIDTSRMLLIGHSEGGVVAARVAGRLPQVTHVALLAAGGPSQLFDLRMLARRGAFFAEVAETADGRERYVLAQWDSIQAHPHAWERTFFGHSFVRWASFLASSTEREIARSRAAVFLAQGASDAVVTRASFDSLAAVLRADGRALQVRLVDGADHSFATPERTDGWAAILREIVRWFGLGA